MRGADEQTGALFSYPSPEATVPKDHPLRAIRPLVNAALGRLSPDSRGSMPRRAGLDCAGKLLRALLLQAFYSVRSERQLMEQLTYNMLFRWFVGLSMEPGLGRDGIHLTVSGCSKATPPALSCAPSYRPE